LDDVTTMRLFRIPAVVPALLLAAAVSAVAGPKRHWQTGTLVDAGRKHDLAIGGAASRTRPPFPPGGVVPTTNGVPEVGTYVFETAEVRLELEAMVPATGSDFEHEITVGQPVTFALEKNTVYVKLANGREHRLRVIRKSPSSREGPAHAGPVRS
jgi:hypothetical protein